MKGVSIASVAAVVLCSGCAPHAWTRADLDGRVICDEQRMQQVERSARLDGAETHWVNCPQATIRVVSNDH